MKTLNWGDLLNGAITAVLSGGSMAVGSIIIDPEHFNSDHLKHLGIVFAAGGLMGLFNWMRTSPWNKV